MKTFRILRLQVRYFFSVRRVKRLTFDLPDWADDACITTSDVNDNPIPHKIKYYKGSTRYYIDLPKCSDAVVVYLTPYTSIVDNKKTLMNNRIIVVDIFD